MATPDRWAPWIEPHANLAADVTVTTTAPVTLSGPTFTCTPHVATRLFIPIVVDVELTAAPGSMLEVLLVINGSPASAFAGFKALTVGERATAYQNYDITVAAGVTTVFTVTAQLDVVGSTYKIHGANFNSKLGPAIALPALHSP